jgi:hypothetical protein
MKKILHCDNSNEMIFDLMRMDEDCDVMIEKIDGYMRLLDDMSQKRQV